MTMSPQSPPPLPTPAIFAGQSLATKDQRVRAGLIDHLIDSSIWFWLFILFGWTAFHLETPLDTRSFLIVLASNFPISINGIGFLLILDLLLCVYRRQSLGQLINNIYKTNQRATSKQFVSVIFDIAKIWLHGLISRCCGMPLLSVSLLIGFILNPMMTPIHLHDFSLIDPEGSFLLMVFLLKIIGWILLLFSLFLPFGLGFMRSPLPTWYDRLLGVYIIEKPKISAP